MLSVEPVQTGRKEKKTKPGKTSNSMKKSPTQRGKRGQNLQARPKSEGKRGGARSAFQLVCTETRGEGKK